MKSLLVFSIIFLVAGCSNKAVYENLQHNQRLHCEQLPISEYERCMRDAEKSYEQYEKERQEYLEAREKETENQS